jgi:hypothetical protein
MKNEKQFKQFLLAFFAYEMLGRGMAQAVEETRELNRLARAGNHRQVALFKSKIISPEAHLACEKIRLLVLFESSPLAA